MSVQSRLVLPPEKEIDQAIGIVLLHVPSAQARQMLRELQRSKWGDRCDIFRAALGALVAAIDRRGPTSYRKEPT